MNGKRTTSGFTLFELILVLAIVVMMVSLAAPTLASFVRSRAVSDAAAEVAAMANFAHNRAIIEGKVYRLSIDPNSNECTLSDYVDDGTDNPTIVTSVSQYKNPYPLPDGLHITSDAPTIGQVQAIEFQPSGICDPATIHLTDVYGNAVDVSCATPYDTYHVSTGPDAVGRH